MRGRALAAIAAIVLAGSAAGATGPAAHAAWLPLIGGDETSDDAGPPAPADGEVGRLAGGDRFATSVDAARRLWPEGADTVVLATGLDYPDALAGAALAAAHDAPMLLAITDRLPDSVRQGLIDLAPERVLLLGGHAALSPELARQVRNLPGQPTVDRIAGADRFRTAAVAAQATGGFDGGDVAVASGFGFADALAAGSLAAGGEPTPVVLASDGRVEADISAADRALLVGAVNARVERDARVRASATRRLAGRTRWATSRAVADVTLTERLSGEVPLVVATGQDFADGLSAGAVAARSDAPLLLIPADGPTRGQAEWISEHHQRLTGAWIVGGPSAVSASAAIEIESLVTGAESVRTTISGTLAGDAELEGGCVWLETEHGRYEVLWPDGWRANADPVELRNPDGQVVARAGDEVEVTGTEAKDAITTCQRGTIFDADEVRVP